MVRVEDAVGDRALHFVDGLLHLARRIIGRRWHHLVQNEHAASVIGPEQLAVGLVPDLLGVMMNADAQSSRRASGNQLIRGVEVDRVILPLSAFRNEFLVRAAKHRSPKSSRGPPRRY